MKKLFTSLVAVFCAMAGMAQTLTFSHDGVAIENGSTFYSRDIDEQYINLLGQTRFVPDIDLSSDVAAKVYMSVQSLDKVSVEFCAIDNTCVTTKVDNEFVAKKEGEWAINELVNMQIHWNAGKLQTNETATTHVVVSAWYEGQEANKVSFTLVMTNDPALSVQQTMGKSESISVQGNVLSYAFADHTAHTLSVYTTNGAKVMSFALAGQEGTLALDELSAGLYVYQVEGKAKMNGKFIIK